MENTKDKCVHEGHRERLTDLMLANGVDKVSDIQAVEFFLTYIFPRGDVNPLAHRLLDEFKTFSHIIDASPTELAKVKGINMRSAKKISLFSEMFYYYTTAKFRKKFYIKNKAQVIDFMEDHLRLRTTENMVFLALSSTGMYLGSKRFKSNGAMSISVAVTDFTDFISSSKAVAVAIAHCHPGGRAYPSKADDSGYAQFKKVSYDCGVNFIDSYILGEDGVYSQNDQKVVREYVDIDDLKKSIEDYFPKRNG